MNTKKTLIMQKVKLSGRRSEEKSKGNRKEAMEMEERRKTGIADVVSSWGGPLLFFSPSF
jgi:hypothetical protein